MNKYFLFFFLFTCISGELFAQTVVRGPYLQTPTDRSIIVMWRTSSNTNSRVWYGTNPNNLSNFISVAGNTRNHTVEITGLQPATKYFYAVGNSNGIIIGPSAQHHFRTNPVPGSEVPVRVWAIGDFGKGNTEQIDVKQSYLNYTGSTHTDVWLWLGDNVYDDGKDSEYQNKVFGLTGFSDIFSWLPFWPSPGNHDYNEVWAQSTTLGIPYTNIPLEQHQGPYFEIVDVPEQAEAGGHPSQLEVFYSFDYGNVHFMSLNSEVFDFTLSYDGINRMKGWIEQDLQQNTKDFTIAYFHQPPYSKGSHDSDDLYELVMKAMRERVIPLLESYDVDLVVCGHSHVFERSYLINGHYGNSGSFNPSTMLKDGSSGNINQGTPYIKDAFSTDPEGTIYVVCGNSGSKTTSSSLNHPVMYYSDGGSQEVGSFVMDIYKNRLDGKYLKSDGNIYDEFTLLKKNLKLQHIGDINLCQGDSVSVAASFTGGSDQLSFDWSGTGLTSQSIKLSPSQNTSYTLTVTDHLTGQVETQNFNINVTPMPLAPVTHSNDTLFVEGGYSYQWYFNGNPIGNLTTDSFLVATQEGNYTVMSFNGNCQRMSAPITHYFISLQNIDDKNVCEGNQVIVQAPYSGGSGNLLFNWSPVGETGSFVVLEPEETTEYTLTISDLVSGQTTSTSFNVNVIEYIEPEIILENDTFKTQQGYQYQWYFNGYAMGGANNYWHVPSQNGNYSVKITRQGCARTSGEVFFEGQPLAITSLEKNGISVFPNPTKSLLNIQVTSEFISGNYKIFDTSGKLLLKGKISDNITQMNLNELPNGQYLLSVSNGKNTVKIAFSKE